MNNKLDVLSLRKSLNEVREVADELGILHLSRKVLHVIRASFVVLTI